MMALSRLKRRPEFLAVAGSGLKAAAPGLVLQARPRDQGCDIRVGFTATRRVGGAVPDGQAESRAAIRSLTKGEARAIYTVMFLERHRLGEIDAKHLREHVLDAVVLHGPRRAIRWLQRTVGVKADGIVGPMTLAAVNTSDTAPTNLAFFKKRMAFIAGIVARDPRQAVFLRGWTKRALSFI